MSLMFKTAKGDLVFVKMLPEAGSCIYDRLDGEMNKVDFPHYFHFIDMIIFWLAF